MNIVANGRPRPVPDGLTVARLVEELGLEPSSIVVERNGTALFRREWDALLAEGDRLEFVRVVAGG
jgi:thiamine biosynthesis protein ThiS